MVVPPTPGAPASPYSPEATLRVARIIWIALVLGVAVFGGVVVVAPIEHSRGPSPDLLFWIAVGMAAVMVPISFLLRSVVHGKARTENGVAHGPWLTGNILQWALCEGAAFFGLVVTMMSDALWPALVPPLVALLGMLVGFPAGSDLDLGVSRSRRDEYAAR